MSQKGIIQIIVISLLLLAVAGSLMVLKKATSSVKPTVRLVEMPHYSPAHSPLPAPVFTPSSPPLMIHSPVPNPVSPNIITGEYEDQTVAYKKGTIFNIKLQDVTARDYESFTSFDPEGIVASTSSASPSAQPYYNESFVGVKTDEASISVLSRPRCSLGKMCPQYIRAFKVFAQIIP